ncbi:hypothetical protein DFH27DRAFT_604566 [Peziza echinospora]|nr:hypothetical protein DFH27DRAFT_604566 [Peziza echinospora]
MAMRYGWSWRCVCASRLPCICLPTHTHNTHDTDQRLSPTNNIYTAARASPIPISHPHQASSHPPTSLHTTLSPKPSIRMDPASSALFWSKHPHQPGLAPITTQPKQPSAKPPATIMPPKGIPGQPAGKASATGATRNTAAPPAKGPVTGPPKATVWPALPAKGQATGPPRAAVAPPARSPATGQPKATVAPTAGTGPATPPRAPQTTLPAKPPRAPQATLPVKPALGPSPMPPNPPPATDTAYIFYPPAPDGLRYRTSTSSTAGSNSNDSSHRNSPTSTAPSSHADYTPQPMTPERAQKLSGLASDAVARAGKGVAAVVAGVGDRTELARYVRGEQTTKAAALGFRLVVVREIGTLVLKLAGYAATPDPNLGDWAFLFDDGGDDDNDDDGDGHDESAAGDTRTRGHAAMARVACSVSQAEFITHVRSTPDMMRDLATVLAQPHATVRCLLRALRLRAKLNSAAHDITVGHVRDTLAWMAATPPARLARLLGWDRMAGADADTAIAAFATAARLLISQAAAARADTQVETLLSGVRGAVYPGVRLYQGGITWARRRQREKFDHFLGTLRDAKVVFRDELEDMRCNVDLRIAQTQEASKSTIEASNATTRSALEASDASLKSALEASNAETKSALEASDANLKSALEASNAETKSALEASHAETKSALEASHAETKSALEATNATIATLRQEIEMLKAHILSQQPTNKP